MPGICPICGKPLGRNKKACSMRCYAESKKQYKVCIVCGKKFQDPQSNMRVTCSRKCASEHRRQMYEAGVYAGTLESAHEAAKDNPLTGRFETHVNAKTWVIKSPTGEIYECRNLYNWLREHETLIDGSVRQAWDGLSKIKYSEQGKRKNPSHQWKGWTLISWGD